MFNAPPTSQIDTSDAACLKRAWLSADAWLAALLALVGLASGVMPDRLPLPRAKRLQALKHVRMLEALLRRLCLTMAARMQWRPRRPRPDASDTTRPAWPRTCAPPPMSHIPAATLGLATLWRHDPVVQTTTATPRTAPAPTLALMEPWPCMDPFSSNRDCGSAPRIRSLDDPPVPAPGPTPNPDLDGVRIARRIAAIRAVLANPEHMARRMARWLDRRAPHATPRYRPTPLCIGTPRIRLDPDQRDMMIITQTIARRWIDRRDSG